LRGLNPLCREHASSFPIQNKKRNGATGTQGYIFKARIIGDIAEDCEPDDS
jgi:hypothetical protein